MNECLSPEKLELLAERKLRGRDFTAALRHLEECAECRAKVRMPSIEEILKRLEDEPPPPTLHPPSGSESEKPDPEFQKLLDTLRRKSHSPDRNDK